MQQAARWLSDHALSSPFVVVVIVLLGLVATRLSRFVVRRIIRRLANAAIRSTRSTPGLWRARSARVGGESGEIGEQRRRQRIRPYPDPPRFRRGQRPEGGGTRRRHRVGFD